MQHAVRNLVLAGQLLKKLPRATSIVALQCQMLDSTVCFMNTAGKDMTPVPFKERDASLQVCGYFIVSQSIKAK